MTLGPGIAIFPHLGVKIFQKKTEAHWAVVLAQLVERSL